MNTATAHGDQTNASPADSAGRPAGAPAAREFVLGPLNRHWYRRCLDGLETNLKNTGSNAGVKQLSDLCDKVVTGFLTAVTAQAPDSDQLQFPADRAYYIPFEGDNAKEFNFAKPFYQYLSGSLGERFHESLWSFFPWDPVTGNVVIDQKLSVSKSSSGHRTIAFDDLLTERPRPIKSENVPGLAGATRLRKSLLLRSDGDDLLKLVFGMNPSPGEPSSGLEVSLSLALAAAFEVYNATYHNPAVEVLLVNHMQVIRWLRLGARDRAGRPLTQGGQDYPELKEELLRAFFLSSDAGVAPLDAAGAKTLDLLRTLVDGGERLFQDVPGNNRQTWAGMLGRYPDSPFMRSLHDGVHQRGGEQARLATDQEFGQETKVVTWLRKLLPNLISFCSHFLAAGTEKRLEEAFIPELRDELLRAGDPEQSFVWVCPDFQTINESLPMGLSEDYQIRGAKKENVDALSDRLSRPLVEFYRRHDLACLQARDSAGQTRLNKLDRYWLARDKPLFKEQLFASFDNPAKGLAVPALRAPASAGSGRVMEPRPQNIFLRVKVCDLSNEPVINGLFVFTTDHDEVGIKNKSVQQRWQDVHDLLAFARVYFFVVRDYLHGWDRARDARDVGRLNLHLYEEMLRRLNERMENCEKRLGSETRKKNAPTPGITQPGNWDRFVYEVLNSYARSLIDKPERVRIETFQYDRLLLLPLATGAGNDEYRLPFYLFQAIFCECEGRRINKTHYALVKPFQSPVESIDILSTNRFRARSFERPTQGKGHPGKHDPYLEKHYVGQQDGPEQSLVPKLMGAGEPNDRGEPSDRGKKWASWVLQNFWTTTTRTLGNLSADSRNSDLWTPFLERLTASFRGLSSAGGTADDADYQWFLFRLGLLRIILRFVRNENPQDKALVMIERQYEQTTLKLDREFDDNQEWNVLHLAEREESSLFKTISEWLALKPDDPSIRFVRFELRDDDPFVLEFLRHLTDHVANDVQTDAGATWFHPLLTRPIGDDRDPETHRRAGQLISHRRPPYDMMRAGDECIGMFLGVVNLEMDTGGLDSRRLSFLVAMLRDYDRTQAGRAHNSDDTATDIADDLQDLTLFTKTFFRNVQGFVRDPIRSQQFRLLSTDAAVIERHWPDLKSEWAQLEENQRKLVQEVNDRDAQRRAAERYVREVHAQPVVAHLEPMRDGKGRGAAFTEHLKSLVMFNAWLAMCENKYCFNSLYWNVDHIRKVLVGSDIGVCIEFLGNYLKELAAAGTMERSVFSHWTGDWPTKREDRRQTDALRLQGDLAKAILAGYRDRLTKAEQDSFRLMADNAKVHRIESAAFLDMLRVIRNLFAKVEAWEFWDEFHADIYDLMRRFVAATTHEFHFGTVDEHTRRVGLWTRSGIEEFDLAALPKRADKKVWVIIGDRSTYQPLFPIHDLIFFHNEIKHMVLGYSHGKWDDLSNGTGIRLPGAENPWLPQHDPVTVFTTKET